MSAELHFAEIGGLFDECDGFDFLSDQNLLEFDLIIIDSAALVNEMDGRSIDRLKKKAAALNDFIARKNIPVVLMFSSTGYFSLFGNGASTIAEVLELDVEEETINGRKIEVNSESIFSDFLRKYIDALEYKVTFAKHPGISIGNAKSKTQSIGFYTKDFVFLPTLKEDCDIDSGEFLHDLYALAKQVRLDTGAIQMPAWAANFYLPGERDENKALKAIEKQISDLEIQRSLTLTRLENYLPLKLLWTASGSKLEQCVKQVFAELGFKILPAESGRADVIMEWNGQPIVTEIKGQTKSAAEKNAAQLEKWASGYYGDHGIMPKPILIVNTFRELPLDQRKEAPFPAQMVPYSESRNHCLMTSLQLCGLLLACRADQSSKDSLINQLINTTGIYNEFKDWRTFITTEKPIVKPKRTNPSSKNN